MIRPFLAEFLNSNRWEALIDMAEHREGLVHSYTLIKMVKGRVEGAS